MQESDRGIIMSAGDPLLIDDRHCFACGPDNKHGLRLEFCYSENKARCVYVASSQFNGWSGMLHGGVVATLLDEAMAHAAIAAGLRAVTARLQIRFRRPAPSGERLILEGIVIKRRARALEITASLCAEDGSVYAQAQGRFIAERERCV